MTEQMPEFMKGQEHVGKEELLRDDPQFWEARALLIGQYKDDPERLAQMVQSTEFAKVKTFAEWRSLAAEYPEPGLISPGLTKYANEDVPVRAFVLKQAILSLFELCKAPAKMRADLALLLDGFLENPATVRANVQALRLEYPDLSWSEICELAQANYRQVMRDKKNWVIAHNPDGGSDPSATP